jgi:hypothetical protein
VTRPSDKVAFDPGRSPYLIEEADFPWTGSLAEQYLFLLRYVVLAPSTHNTQPWKFSVSENGIEVFADYSRRLRAADPGNRELVMSIGAAMYNLRVAAGHFGFSCTIDYEYSGASDRPIAVAALAPVPGYRETDSLFSCIVRRHTNRQPFLQSRVPRAVLNVFSGLAEGSRVSLKISADGSLNGQVAELVAVADRMQLADPEFRRDVAEWMRPNWTERLDGIPVVNLGFKGVASALTPLAARVLDLGSMRGTGDRSLCSEAPALIILHSEDSIPRWVEAGEILERVLLTLIREGLQASYFNMPIKVPELRVKLRSLLGIPSWPQVLLRVGFCLAEVSPTPRRPVEDVLVKPGTF